MWLYCIIPETATDVESVSNTLYAVVADSSNQESKGMDMPTPGATEGAKHGDAVERGNLYFNQEMNA